MSIFETCSCSYKIQLAEIIGGTYANSAGFMAFYFYQDINDAVCVQVQHEAAIIDY